MQSSKHKLNCFAVGITWTVSSFLYCFTASVSVLLVQAVKFGPIVRLLKEKLFCCVICRSLPLMSLAQSNVWGREQSVCGGWHSTVLWFTTLVSLEGGGKRWNRSPLSRVCFRVSCFRTSLLVAVLRFEVTIVLIILYSVRQTNVLFNI